jgi:hypothetical protein
MKLREKVQLHVFLPQCEFIQNLSASFFVTECISVYWTLHMAAVLLTQRAVSDIYSCREGWT